MNIQTTRFGEIEIDSKQIITFSKGIPGFEAYTEFALIAADENIPFYFLQSISEAELCFILVDPFVFYPTYKVKIDDNLIGKLEIEKQEDVTIYTLVTVQDSLQKATTNLKGPLVLNLNKQLGQQMILDNEEYLIKQPLLPQQQSEQASSRVSTGNKG